MGDYESRLEDAKQEHWEDSHTGECSWCRREIGNPYGGLCDPCIELHDLEVNYPDVRNLVEAVKQLRVGQPMPVTFLRSLANRFPDMEEEQEQP